MSIELTIEIPILKVSPLLKEVGEACSRMRSLRPDLDHIGEVNGMVLENIH